MRRRFAPAATATDDLSAGPFLSVLVRTQGRRRAALAQTLSSLAGQESDDFEVLVLAHDVPDDRHAVLDSVVGSSGPALSGRLRVVDVRGGGRSHPLNEGARHAKGNYLAILDDDDFVLPDWVNAFREAATSHPGRVVHTAVATQRVAGDPDGEIPAPPGDDPRPDYPLVFDFLDHLVDNRTPSNGFAIPRSVVVDLGIEFDESLPVLEDWDMLLRAASVCGVTSCGRVTALTRVWQGDDSKDAHSPETWESARRAVIAKLDRSPLLLDRGSFSALRGLVAEADEARRALRSVQKELGEADTVANASQAALVAIGEHRDLAELAVELNQTKAELEAATASLGLARQQLHDTLHSTSWKMTRSTRALSTAAQRVMRRLRPSRPALDDHDVDAAAYLRWIKHYDTLDEDTAKRLTTRLADLSSTPLFSVVVPAYNTPQDFLRAAVDSVRAQLYTHWELCIADDNSTDPSLALVLEEYQALDDRIKLVRRAENGHISAATNSALELATGDFVAFLDHDDTLAPHALALVALALDGHDTAAVVYSDEDKLDDQGRRHTPYFKPDFDPLLLMGQNYMTHFLVIRRDLVTSVGGLRVGYEGAQDWDLVLRVSELVEPEQVLHIPRVLYHWRAHGASTAERLDSKPYASDAGLRSVQDHLARTKVAAEVSTIPASGHNRVRFRSPEPAPRVSVVIPTRDGPMLQQCVDSVRRRTDYPNIELVIVDNGSEKPQTLAYLEALAAEGATILRDERPFNYSALNNEAVAASTGELVMLLNDDTEVIAGQWLDEMVRHISQPGVGAVGAMLYYDDELIQHAGVTLGVGGVAGHAYRREPRGSFGYMGRLLLAQTMTAVTAACVLIRRQAWDEVGGLEEDNLAVAFNDVDLCLRLGQAGWRIVWTPTAELLHHESISRGTEEHRADEFAAEIRYMQRRWGRQLMSDPSYNPNLTVVHENWTLAWPPRISW